MIRRTPIIKRTDTLVAYTTLCRSQAIDIRTPREDRRLGRRGGEIVDDRLDRVRFLGDEPLGVRQRVGGQIMRREAERLALGTIEQIGRASCRERVCQYV